MYPPTTDRPAKFFFLKIRDTRSTGDPESTFHYDLLDHEVEILFKIQTQGVPPQQYTKYHPQRLHTLKLLHVKSTKQS